MEELHNMWAELSEVDRADFIEAMESISGLIKNACGLIVEAVEGN